MERPSLIDGKREEHTYRVEIDERGEYLDVINAICLVEATSNQTSFVTCNSTIKMIFTSEDPLAYYNVGLY